MYNHPMAAPHPVLAHRAESLARYGVRTMDVALAAFRCPSCGVDVPDPSVRVIAAIGYRDLSSLVAYATRLGADLRESPSCPACATTSVLERFDYHAFHSSAKRDLVVRVHPRRGELGSARHELAWWTPGTEPVTIAALSPEQVKTVERDALLRGAQTELEVGGVDRALPTIERALESIPGDPDLMRLVPVLLSAGRSGLAGAICDAHIAAHPQDPSGHFGLADVVIQVVAHGAWPLEKLSEADAALQRVLEIDPEHLEGRMALGTLMRLRGEDEPALGVYRRLLEKHDDFGPLHYNIGSLLLARGEAESALRHFTAGEALDLTDPDYALGRARALWKLGRVAEARAALEKARKMAPDDARVAQVTKELA